MGELGGMGVMGVMGELGVDEINEIDVDWWLPCSSQNDFLKDVEAVLAMFYDDMYV